LSCKWFLVFSLNYQWFSLTPQSWRKELYSMRFQVVYWDLFYSLEIVTREWTKRKKTEEWGKKNQNNCLDGKTISFGDRTLCQETGRKTRGGRRQQRNQITTVKQKNGASG